jgi:hypothetical protein
MGKATSAVELKLVTSFEYTHTQCEIRDQKLLWTVKVPLDKGK